MNNEEYIDNLLLKMRENRPPRLPIKDDNLLKGEHAILGYISSFNSGVTAGSISNFLKISTARVAAALNSLENKGYVKRITLESDKRITMVSLTNKGKTYHNEHINDLKMSLNLIINEIGIDRFKEYVETTNTIKKILERNNDNV